MVHAAQEGNDSDSVFSDKHTKKLDNNHLYNNVHNSCFIHFPGHDRI